MKKNNKLNPQKLHFRFKNFSSLNKHIVKFGFFAYKINYTLCVSKIQEDFFKLFILKSLKLITSRKAKIFYFSNCFYTKTKLPSESRMGKGKGEVFCSFSYYKRGFILFEITELPYVFAHKLKIKLNKKKIFCLSLI